LAYKALAVRWMLLAYNRNNRVGGGCQDEDTGLTPFGRDVVREMERLDTLVTVQRRAGGSDEARARQVWLSQESLAEMCGMSRISAARALRRLAQLGWVRTHARFVEVVDLAGLGAL
jgi:broad specificity phosphatase PhoE